MFAPVQPALLLQGALLLVCLLEQRLLARQLVTRTLQPLVAGTCSSTGRNSDSRNSRAVYTNEALTTVATLGGGRHDTPELLQALVRNAVRALLVLWQLEMPGICLGYERPDSAWSAHLGQRCCPVSAPGSAS